jgi:hypothetical protein
MRLLATVLGQDLEPPVRRYAFARKVAPDRVISTVDAWARHGHKTIHRGSTAVKATSRSTRTLRSSPRSAVTADNTGAHHRPRWLGGPEAVHDQVDGDHPTGSQQQSGQDPLFAAAGQGDRPTTAGHLQRTEHGERHDPRRALRRDRHVRPPFARP